MAVNAVKCSWADLPPDLLTMIADCLDVTSTIRLSAVCKLWASVLHPCLPRLPPFCRNKPVPWLVRSPQISSKDSNSTDLIFDDLVTATTYSFSTPIPSLCGHLWWGSQKGWLVTVSPRSQLQLIKPLTGAHVLLPYNYTVRHYPWKVIICRTPDSKDGYLVVTLDQPGRLLYAKARMKSWTLMHRGYFEDAALCKGKVIAITSDTVACWNIAGSSVICEWFICTGEYRVSNWWTKFIEWRQRKYMVGWIKYIVEWRGELHVVTTENIPCVRSRNHALGKIRLYKINIKMGSLWFSRVRSLGNYAVFLGPNFAYAVPTSGVDNVRKNCIYFTDTQWPYHSTKKFQAKYAFGVFDMRKKKYKLCRSTDSHIHLQAPVWFWPC